TTRSSWSTCRRTGTRRSPGRFSWPRSPSTGSSPSGSRRHLAHEGGRVAERPQVEDAPGAGHRSPFRALVRWECALLLLLGATILYGASASSAFFQSGRFFYIGLNVCEVA